MTVTLIDYGAGNATSVERALNKLGAPSERASTPDAVSTANVLLLPGVGHFAALLRSLDDRGLREPLLDALRRGVPFLGICLGLQALYQTSEEASQLRGLSLLEGNVQALPATVKLPHMGWNHLDRKRDSRLLTGINENSFFYFAHSFAACDEDASTVATCSHGTKFVAVLERDNIFAVQFHPEKSGAPGAQLLSNFLKAAA
ncbi:MAG: imidazole glycerol phosphate synthase subunit HisH [Candidatus Acidiferrum sp.]